MGMSKYKWTIDDVDKLFDRVEELEQNHASQERLIQEIRLGKHQDRDEGRQAAEAGGSNSPVDATQSQGEEAAQQVGGYNRYPTLEYPDGYYIAGPMSGYADHNFEAFNETAKRMRKHGIRVVNPAEINPDKPGYSVAMRRDIHQMLTCHRIMLLPGWERSKGAMVEFQLAIILEMGISYWSQACNLFK